MSACFLTVGTATGGVQQARREGRPSGAASVFGTCTSKRRGLRHDRALSGGRCLEELE